MEIQGYVEHIVFRNEDNGYSVINLTENTKEHCLVESFPLSRRENTYGQRGR